MLEKCNTVLLISDKASFRESYTELCRKLDVTIHTEEKWNSRYKITEDAVILGSVHLSELNTAYYSKAVVILKEGESPAPYIKDGINRFIFNYKNSYELIVALFRLEPVMLHAVSKDIKEILKDFPPVFRAGEYDFRFDSNVYIYKGRSIYLCMSQKKYLAEWLLSGHKDNSKRMILCNLRKKFGKDFLSNVDRFGQLKEEKNEQQIQETE